MISRRFLLGAAPAALAAHSLPAIAAPLSIAVSADTGAVTAGLEQLALDYYANCLRHGLMTIREIRAAENMPPLDLEDLLQRRATPFPGGKVIVTSNP